MADAEQLPATFDIKMVAGDDYDFDVLVEDSNGNAIDFSNWSNEKLQVRSREGASSTLQEYTTSAGDLTTTAGGRVQCTFDATDTKDWALEAVYEFEGSDGNSNNRTALKGTITVNRQVSQ